MLAHFVEHVEKKDEHEVRIQISANCPLGFAHDAVFKFRTYLVERINEALKADQPKELEPVKEE